MVELGENNKGKYIYKKYEGLEIMQKMKLMEATIYLQSTHF
jgi:hypothetical protein